MAMVVDLDMEKDRSTESPRDNTKGARGAQFALQVALQTMKERCQQLQRRLATLEDENVAMRRQISRSGADDKAAEEPESLKEQVAVLSLQKAQLSQQMQMVAAENRQLWLRLSRLYQANQTLGSHLTRFSETLNQHSATSPPPFLPQVAGESSLEEISLKLANSIMQEKLDLEQQCAQMVELQSSTSSPLDLQTLAADGDGSDALTAHFKRLTEVRDLLLGQQKSLKTGIEALSTKKPAPSMNNAAANTSIIDDIEIRQISSLREWGDSASQPRHTEVIPDWTCPMCGQFFSCDTVKFEVFHAHVSSHFIPDIDDETIATFAIID